MRCTITLYSISQPDLVLMLMAFTFSYPVSQSSTAHGVLQRWTKGFNIRGVEGEDVVAQMERAFRRKVRSAHADLALTLLRLTPYRG